MRWLSLIVLLLLPIGARADVSFDGSMGPVGPAPTRVSPGFGADYLVSYDEATANPADRFGVRRGPNLFQSLDHLDLGYDERVSFLALDPAGQPIQDLDRVIARITSGSRSAISGVLRSEIPGADLFLLNPAGIDFRGQGGARRQLDLRGGFVASTADFLRFEDDAILHVDPLQQSVLSSSPVASFGFLGGAQQGIVFDRAGLLALPQGEDLTVVAADVSFTGLASTDPSVPSQVTQVQVPGGDVRLAAVANVAVEVPVEVEDWAVRDAPGGSLGSVTVEAFSEIRTNDTSGDQGRVVMRGGLLVVDDSRVQAGGAGAGTLALDLKASDEIVARNDARLQVLGSRPAGLGGARLSARRIEVSGTTRRTFVGPRPTRNTADPFRVEADELLVTGAASLVTEVSGAGGTGAELRVIADRISVSNGGELGTRALTGAGPGGKVVIDAQRLEISGGSVRSDNFLLAPDGSRIFAGGQAGDLEIEARTLVMTGDARIEAFAGPAGDGGNISITADRVEMRERAQINSSTLNDRDAGDVTVVARERVDIRGDDPAVPAGIFARSGDLVNGVVVAGSGDGGAIAVRGEAGLGAPSVSLTGSAVISARSRGAGNAGSIKVEASQLTLSGDATGAAEISARAQDGDLAGSISIDADTVALEGGAAIAVSTAGRSPGGRIDLDARTLEVRGVRPGAAATSSALLSDTLTTASDAGDAGTIDIDLTQSLLVTDGAEIRAVTRGAGDAGSIVIVVEPTGSSAVVSAGGNVSAAALAGSTGEAGDVSIRAPRIALERGSLTTETRNGTAEGADVGGDIRLAADWELRLSAGSVVSARSVGTQDAGRISIDAGRRLLVADSEITTEATEETASAAGGQIEITASEKVELRGSTVTTSVRAFEGNEDGGDITIDPRFVILDESQILAQAVFGDGGNITIVAGSYLESADSLVSASSQLGIDGIVDVRAPDTDLKGELTRLPASFLDATRLLREHCAARVAGRGSFVVTGSEGRTAAPDRPLSAPIPLPDEMAPIGAAVPLPASGDGEARDLWLATLDCAALAADVTRAESRP